MTGSTIAEAPASGSKNLRACAVEGCGHVVRTYRPFCEAHWAELPGTARAKLSLSARWPNNPVCRDAVERAALSLGAA